MGAIVIAFVLFMGILALLESKEHVKPVPCIDNGMTKYREEIVDHPHNYVLYKCGEK